MRDLFELTDGFFLEVVYRETGCFTAKLLRSAYSSKEVVQEKVMNSSWTDEQIVTLVKDWQAGSWPKDPYGILDGNPVACRLTVSHLKRVRDELKLR